MDQVADRGGVTQHLAVATACGVKVDGQDAGVAGGAVDRHRGRHRQRHTVGQGFTVSARPEEGLQVPDLAL